MNRLEDAHSQADALTMCQARESRVVVARVYIR